MENEGIRAAAKSTARAIHQLIKENESVTDGVPFVGLDPSEQIQKELVKFAQAIIKQTKEEMETYLRMHS